MEGQRDVSEDVAVGTAAGVLLVGALFSGFYGIYKGSEFIYRKIKNRKRPEEQFPFEDA